MNSSIPTQVQKYFWGDDLSELSLKKNKKYIAQILLEKADGEALSWFLKNVDSNEILEMLPSLRLSAKSRNFWKIYLS